MNRAAQGNLVWRLTAMAVILCATVAVPTLGADSPFSWVDQDGALRLMYEGKPLLQYNYEPVKQPEGVAEAFARSAYIHPVWNTAGQIVTDDFPRDHYHQRGVFFAWTKTEFGDLHPDFWNLGTRSGRIVFEAFEGRSTGADSAELVVRHRWEASRDGKWELVLRERWTLRAHVPEAGAPDHWILDLTSRQECATETPLVLPQYFYGGMAYRGHHDWIANKAAVTVLTSEGHDRAAADETNARWCMMGGPLDGGWGGVTIMDHPSNVRFPNRLRVHPGVPYFGFMLPQAEAYTIAPGQALVLQYRIVVHAKMPDAAFLNGL
jgi:hypothetical protein